MGVTRPPAFRSAPVATSSPRGGAAGRPGDEPLAAASLDRSLRGEVDTILATALEKDPGQRYASAAALPADIRRHLGDEHDDTLDSVHEAGHLDVHHQQAADRYRAALAHAVPRYGEDAPRP